jgi:hypothetical protein
VTTRRRIRIDVELPELTPAQADFLWNFLDGLAADLWDAYESEVLEVENQRSRPLEPDNDWPAEYDDLTEHTTLPHVGSEENDPDF